MATHTLKDKKQKHKNTETVTNASTGTPFDYNKIEEILVRLKQISLSSKKSQKK